MSASLSTPQTRWVAYRPSSMIDLFPLAFGLPMPVPVTAGVCHGHFVLLIWGLSCELYFGIFLPNHNGLRFVSIWLILVFFQLRLGALCEIQYFFRPPGVRGPIPNPSEVEKNRDENVMETFPTETTRHPLNPAPYVATFFAYTLHLPAIKLKREF